MACGPGMQIMCWSLHPSGEQTGLVKCQNTVTFLFVFLLFPVKNKLYCTLLQHCIFLSLTTFSFLYVVRDAMFGSKDPTCPFFAFFSLADILDAASPDGIVVGYSR